MPLACSKLPCTRTIHGWASLDKKHLFPALTADHPRKLPKIWQSASRSKAALGQRDHSVTLRVWTLTMPGYGLRFPCFCPHCTKISLCRLKRAQDLENGKFQPDKAISWRIANVMLEDCVHMNIFLKFWVPQTISVFFCGVLWYSSFIFMSQKRAWLDSFWSLGVIQKNDPILPSITLPVGSMGLVHFPTLTMNINQSCG